MDHVPLQIIIVGSGIAGLTAARILRPHHRVTVYERGNAAIATGGQGIMISPNGVKILSKIGYSSSRANSIPIQGIRTYDIQGSLLEDVDMQAKQRFGIDFIAQKRSDFRDELLRLATMPSEELEIGGEPATMVFGKEVTSVDTDEGTVTLSDGSAARADVVVIADGIHSHLRTSITGNSNDVSQKTGLTCYRVAVSLEDVQKALRNLPLPHWWDPNTSQNYSSIIYSKDGSMRMITVYPIRPGQSMFNLSCILRIPEHETDENAAASWNASGDKETMLDHFADFGDQIHSILSAATEIKIWTLQELSLSVHSSWVRGRAILIGDAAHAMTPMQGQGANMSIEDAESLSLLTPGSQRDNVNQILKRVESVRKARVRRVLEETRKSHDLTSVAERVIRNLEWVCEYEGIVQELEKRDVGRE